MNFVKQLLRKKSISETTHIDKGKALVKSLGALDLVLLGIGCTIGTGIFVLTGITAAVDAGPGVAFSYLFAGIACMFAALAYAELAAMVPVAGSAYTYSYVTMGEFVAWLVGWGLVLEYTVGASTVAAGWSGYMVGILKSGGIIIPEYLTKVPSDGGIINLPATCIALFIGLLLFRGTKESVMLNRILVVIKLVAIFIFLIVAVPHIDPVHYENFLPYGWNGVFVGAGAIFFAYVGFDAVATAAEECKNPEKDLPIGIIGSLLICTALYIGVSLALTGIVSYTDLNNPEPLASALRANGSNIGGALVATGAITGMTSVLLVLMYGQSRIAFVMSRDGLFPGIFSRLHKKYRTPYISSIFVSLAVALTSGFTPIRTMSHLCSLGTLFAFLVVSVGVLVLRYTRPELARPFRCPAVKIVAPAAIISCGYLIFTLLSTTGKPFLIWVVIGLVVYFAYGFRKSPLGNNFVSDIGRPKL